MDEEKDLGLFHAWEKHPGQQLNLSVSGSQTRLRKHGHLFTGCLPFQARLNDCTFGKVFFLSPNVVDAKS